MKLLAVLLLSLLAGCVITPENRLALFNAHKPRSIVVVPVVNESVEISAPSVFIPTLVMPLAERGFYVFPVYLTDLVLRDFGLTEAGHIHQLPIQRFYELFGADAVLFVTIKDWSSKYLVLASWVVVEAEYLLKDTKTGAVLWQSEQRITNDSGGSDIVTGLVSAALNAMTTDYLPLARQANQQAFQPPSGLPAGPYNKNYCKEQSQF
jgi:hypothetical protein